MVAPGFDTTPAFALLANTCWAWIAALGKPLTGPWEETNVK